MYGQTVNTSDADSGSSAAATSTGAIAGWRLVLPIGWRGIFAIPSCWSLKGVHTRGALWEGRGVQSEDVGVPAAPLGSEYRV